MRIISAKKREVSEISVCRRESIENVNSNCYSPAALKELIDDQIPEKVLEEFLSCEIYSLKKKGKIIGSVSFDKNKIDGLYICSNYVGRGYGQKLLKFAERKIKRKGYWEVFLYSTLNSEKFYLNQGYLPGEILIGLSKEPLPFIEMAKKLE
jgi:GNAT superfamily N-acetyltransferase